MTISLEEHVARAIYEEFENRPDYAKLQMNVVLAGELARAAIAAVREYEGAAPHKTITEQWAESFLDHASIGHEGPGTDGELAVAVGIADAIVARKGKGEGK
jgi:hypothetical protein